MSRPLRSATVTFQAPARSVFCRLASAARSAATSPRPHCSRQRLLQAPEIARGLVHVRLARLRHSAGGPPGRCRSDAPRRACARPAGGPGSPAARRRRDRRRFSPGSRAAVRARTARACRHSALRPRSKGSRESRARVDGVLGEPAFRHLDLAAAADAAPAADRIEIDAERARRLQHGRPFGKIAALARWREDDAMGGQGSLRPWRAGGLRAGRRRRPLLLPARARDICGSRRRSSDRGP